MAALQRHRSNICIELTTLLQAVFCSKYGCDTFEAKWS